MVFPTVFLVTLARARSWLISGALGLTELREVKGNRAVEPRGFEKDVFDVGTNEFLSELLCTAVIKLSRDKVTLTFAAPNIRCLAKKEKSKKKNGGKNVI